MPADDPYRTLGLERTASLDEVKRAYRRLVKANHPDAAGEAALPRFLAIQDAYDRIVGPDDGNGRTSPRAARPGPWQADPDRTGATYRAYGGRPRPRRDQGPVRAGRRVPPARRRRRAPAALRRQTPAPGRAAVRDRRVPINRATPANVDARRRRSGRPRTTTSIPTCSRPTGAAPRGTARRLGPTGPSTPRSTPTRASMARSTRHERGARVAFALAGRPGRRRGPDPIPPRPTPSPGTTRPQPRRRHVRPHRPPTRRPLGGTLRRRSRRRRRRAAPAPVAPPVPLVPPARPHVRSLNPYTPRRRRRSTTSRRPTCRPTRSSLRSDAGSTTTIPLVWPASGER